MTKVRDLMKSEVATVTPETTVADFVEFLDRHSITGAPVVDSGGALVGVVSVRDVVRLARQMDEVPEAMRWGLGRPLAPDPSTLLDPGVEGEFFAYFVTEGGGFVDVSSRIRELPQKLFEGYEVETIMSPAPVTISPDATVVALARSLRDRNIHRVLVVEDGQLVGIVTTTDLLDHVADGGA